jgi:hypothetical protein
VGLVWKRDKNRGFWAKRPFLPPFSVQNRERGDRAAAGLEGRGAGGPGRCGGRGMGKHGEGDEGISSPCSPWTEAARGESSTGGGGPMVVVLGAAQMVVGGCRASLLGVVWGGEGGGTGLL